jgi:plastocyanin
MRSTSLPSTIALSFFLVLALSLFGCGDSDGEDGSCDPATNDACICETEAGGACDDPDDLDCFCFLDDGGGNNGANNGATDRATVDIANFAFSPSNTTINVGGQVTWTNSDQAQHTITMDDGSFDELINPGASFTATFNSVGTFRYHDRLNNQPGLKGTITVQ